ncbi:YybH family protein [Mucilaginibacter sp. AW1-3]
MKKYLLILFCFLLLTSCFLSAQAQNRQAILKVLHIQQLAWNRGDLDAFMQGYWHSDSLVFVGKTAPTYGWQPTLDHYKKSYPDKATMGELVFTITKVDVLDNTNAFVLGGWHLKREKGDVGGYFTLWFKRIDGKWVIVCDHTS